MLNFTELVASRAQNRQKRSDLHLWKCETSHRDKQDKWKGKEPEVNAKGKIIFKYVIHTCIYVCTYVRMCLYIWLYL